MTFKCGHPRDEANTYKRKGRCDVCRTCQNAQARAQGMRKRQRMREAALRDPLFVSIPPVMSRTGRCDTPRLSDIITVIARFMNIAEEDITGPGRQRRLMIARAALMVVARTKSGLRPRYSYPAISDACGRDHSTSMYWQKCASYYARTWTPSFDKLVEQVEFFATHLPPFIAETDWQPAEIVDVMEEDEAKAWRDPPKPIKVGEKLPSLRARLRVVRDIRETEALQDEKQVYHILQRIETVDKAYALDMVRGSRLLKQAIISAMAA